MPQCEHYHICHRNGGEGAQPNLCILHSQFPVKDAQAFATAFDTHRKERGDNFTAFVFPEKFSFSEKPFPSDVNFSGATFSANATFLETTFSKGANFDRATFNRKAFFDRATFSEATFSAEVDFIRMTFGERANFDRATFKNRASFYEVTFREGADFSGTTFDVEAFFRQARFKGRTSFSGERAKFIFCGATIDFSDITLEPLEALILRDVDLQHCHFLNTDLRKAEITGAKWPQAGGRAVVYDEIASRQEGKFPPWSRLERLYRELKQNYEDRRDYERAGDFHYGEKEMRRKNAHTSSSLRFLLTLYWAASGYGERYLRPLAWAIALFVIATVLYLRLGLKGEWTGGAKPTLSMANVGDWLQAAHYSFRVMTFLKPEQVATPISYSRVVHTVQSILSPLFLGLFALAVRQRLKR